MIVQDYMNIHTTLMLGCTAVAVSSAFGAERAAESKVAPDIAEVRQMLGSLLKEKAETDIFQILDDETLRLFSKDAEFIVKVEDGALEVTEYGVEGKPVRAQRGSHKLVDGRNVWTDDSGWVARSHVRIPAEVKKETLRKVWDRIVGNLEKGSDSPTPISLTMKPSGGIWCISDDRISLGIWFESKDSDGEARKDVMSCSFRYRDGRWRLEMMAC